MLWAKLQKREAVDLKEFIIKVLGCLRNVKIYQINKFKEKIVSHHDFKYFCFCLICYVIYRYEVENTYDEARIVERNIIKLL
ncbi:MAG: hypothetical protein QME51_04340 [Planctomycetota bacterium]|nr:hypothetical protein [Planctomycetota bacterium]